MNRSTFSPSARRDLHAIFDHIAADNPRAALDFVERIEESCQRLQDLRPFRRSPMLAVLTADQGVGFGVALDVLGLGIERQRSAQPRGDVAQVAQRG